MHSERKAHTVDFKTLLKKDYILLDGGFGTELIKRGFTAEDRAELSCFTHPELVKDIHRSYIEAGSNIIYANTFNATPFKFEGGEHTFEEAISEGIRIAKQAAEGTDVLVGLDVSPLGKLLEPTGDFTFEEAYEAFGKIVRAGEKAGADLIGLETFSDIYELRAAVLAAKDFTSLPVLASLTFEENGRTFTGCSGECAARILQSLGVDAIGVNCGLGPDLLLPVVKEILQNTTLPVIVKPNAGLPDPVTGKFGIDASQFGSLMEPIMKMGAKLIGGCCGTAPEYIAKLRELSEKVKPERIEYDSAPCVCSGSTFVRISEPRIIGERINPTGKKLFKEALRNGDINYILRQAIEQVSAGADILDINVGLPDIDEKEMMVKIVKAVQSVTDVPLQLDSTNPEVLEAGLRVYNGKAIINSVNGEEASLSAILPLVKKYGAAVVGLTLDENGIPKKAQERFEIAKKILSRAQALGIPKEDIFIDCLTLTASVEQDAVKETLLAVKMVTENLGLKTVLGVSNISFGLPNRELINHTFLTMALQNGLTLPIINPNIASMVGVVRAYKVLSGIDRSSAKFVEAYNNAVPAQAVASKEITLEYAISTGLKDDAKKITSELLQTLEAEEVINTRLIPALDVIGTQFESGKIFLPQLILSADTAGVCFDVIKAKLQSERKQQEPKGSIIIATVKGDIHDIGKNIVRTVLENYGFEVLDLGKDVPEEVIVKEAVERDIKLVGLSALMTTTLGAMENTIKLLKQAKPDCAVMVGGAVLTEDYAEKIGADFYAKDAKASADIAKKYFGV